MRPLILVRPTAPPPVPMHPDSRAASALHTAVEAAWHDGHGAGEWEGHLTGWRSGLLCGLCWGGLLTAIGAAAANHWGWL